MTIKSKTEWWKVQPTERCHLTFRVDLSLNYTKLKSSSHHAQRFISLIILDSFKLTIRIKHHSPQRSPRRGFFDVFIIGLSQPCLQACSGSAARWGYAKGLRIGIKLKMFKQCLKIGVLYKVHLEAFENTVTHKDRLWRLKKKGFTIEQHLLQEMSRPYISPSASTGSPPAC